MLRAAPKGMCSCPTPLVWFSGRSKAWLSAQRRATLCLFALALSLFNLCGFAASDHHSQVTFGGLPVPGATVTATKGDKRLGAVTDQQGVYTFADLDDGVWTFQVEMFGFATQTQDITITGGTPSPVWELKLLPLAEITREIPPAPAGTESTPAASPPASTGGRTPAAGAQPAAKAKGFERATVNSASTAPAPAPPPASDASTTANEASSDLNQSAATGLLVNGSVNNGAASAFAQVAAFGNNRKGPASLYNGSAGAIFDTSSWDAAPVSLSGIAAPKPSYNNVEFFGSLGGPLRLPHRVIANSNFFVAYQHQANDDASVLPGLVPTLLQRSGNFSQTLNSAGNPVQVFNPATGMPFPGNIVPVSTQAQALLSEYPMPNLSGTGLYNYQAAVLNTSQQNSVQARVSKNRGRNQFFGTFAYQGATSQATNLFGFQDSTYTSGLDAAANWSRSYQAGTSYLVIHFKYEFSRLARDVTPFFANRSNVSGQAEIAGNDQEPVNWGPPNLIFSSGVAGLSEPAYTRNANQTQAFSYDTLWYRRRHTVQFGGDARQQQFNILSQQDARGTFAFTGAATAEMSGGLPVIGTGSDLADFILGIPDTAQISFGNPDKYLRGWGFDAFINDDWRVNSGLSLNVGLRWEFAEPLTELHDRLANLDIAPGFTAAAPVLASDPTGAVTGQSYPNSLVRPDYRGVEPRLGIAWRPRPASPLVIRAGYGIYDNTSVYQVVATQLAQQPPFTKTLSIQNSVAQPLTLATAFNTGPSGTDSTFAVGPNFRIGYAQNWNASVQEDLPGSMVLTATYLGIKGTRLMQESLPNTYPVGAANPCPTCPLGFVYLTSNGNSTREAGQIQLRRRLSNGLAATLQYTYSKSVDDAAAFSGAGLVTGGPSQSGATPLSVGLNAPASTPNPNSPSVAQNWLNLGAERGPSTFDQRNLLTFTMQYTSGEGIRGNALLSGWRGTLLKEWTFAPQLTYGSGLPETPVYLTNVAGTGITGTIRPNYTGVAVNAAPAGLFLNPAAYSAPAPGQWGDAGRDSIIGPAQFSLNASIGRTFRLGSRLDGTWRMDAFNVLNTVTYTSYNTTVTSPLFGLPSQANTMRKLQMSFRVRF
jgi:hypothetical protein